MGSNATPTGITEESLTVEQAIANLQQTEDPSSRYYAAWWIGRFRVREPIAIDALIQALDDETDRSPDGGYPLRRNAARALGKVGDRQSVLPLTACLTCPDYYVREAAAQSLEELGDASCAAALAALLDGGMEDTELRPGIPHLRQPYDAAIEALGTLGIKDAVPIIQPFVEHPVPRIRYAAARAMYQLTQENRYGDRLVQALGETDLQLRRTALMDLGATGYVPAAGAIAQTHAENSLKLIALKGLLESHLASHGPTTAEKFALPASAIHIMELMDSLL